MSRHITVYARNAPLAEKIRLIAEPQKTEASKTLTARTAPASLRPRSFIAQRVTIFARPSFIPPPSNTGSSASTMKIISESAAKIPIIVICFTETLIGHLSYNSIRAGGACDADDKLMRSTDDRFTGFGYLSMINTDLVFAVRAAHRNRAFLNAYSVCPQAGFDLKAIGLPGIKIVDGSYKLSFAVDLGAQLLFCEPLQQNNSQTDYYQQRKNGDPKNILFQNLFQIASPHF